jgi:hypothetical protein
MAQVRLLCTPVVISLSLVSGCVGLAATGTPTILTSPQERQVKALIAKELRDPESARFGSHNAAWQKEHLVVCGWVNSKNGFGGYAGDTKYVARFTEGKDKSLSLDLLRLGDNLDGSLLLSVLCSNAGIAFPGR